MQQHTQRPLMTVLDGDRMSADDAAYLAVADAAANALTLPGVSDECGMRLRRMVSAGDRAAGLPPRALPQARQQPA